MENGCGRVRLAGVLVANSGACGNAGAFAVIKNVIATAKERSRKQSRKTDKSYETGLLRAIALAMTERKGAQGCAPFFVCVSIKRCIFAGQL